jgi:hypothetical protein
MLIPSPLNRLIVSTTSLALSGEITILAIRLSTAPVSRRRSRVSNPRFDLMSESMFSSMLLTLLTLATYPNGEASTMPWYCSSFIIEFEHMIALKSSPPFLILVAWFKTLKKSFFPSPYAKGSPPINRTPLIPLLCRFVMPCFHCGTLRSFLPSLF